MLTNKIKKQVLFATTNPAKIKKYAEKLKERDIEVLTVKDHRRITTRKTTRNIC